MVAMPFPYPRIAVHPGEHLAEAIAGRGVTAYKVAKACGVTQIQISRILHGKAGISPRLAHYLGRYFGTAAEFWANLQTAYELAKAFDELGGADALEAVEALPEPEPIAEVS